MRYFILSFRTRGNDSGKSAEKERDEWCKVSDGFQFIPPIIFIAPIPSVFSTYMYMYECSPHLSSSSSLRQFSMVAALDVNLMHAYVVALSLVGLHIIIQYYQDPFEYLYT